MHKIKIFCFIRLFLCLPFFISFVYAETKIRVGVYNFKPLVAINPEKGAEGFFIDILEHIAASSEWKLVYVPGSWNECLDRAIKGEIDLLPSIAFSEQRVEVLDFTDQYLFLDWGIVFRRKGAKIENIFDLEGKRVSALKGSIYTIGFKNLLDQFGIKCEIIEKDESAAVFQSIDAGEVDAGINAQMYGMQLEADYKLEKTEIFFSPVKIRFAAPKMKNPLLIKTLDYNLAALKSNKQSVYYTLFHKWVEGYEEKKIFPPWLFWSLIFIAAGLLISLFFIFILNSQVKKRTEQLKNLNLVLHENEERYRQLAENIRGVFWICSPDWKEILYISPAYELIWGRSCRSLYENPLSWLDAIAAEDKTKVEADMRLKAGGDLSRPDFPEYRIIHPDGSRRWILAHAFPIYNAQNQIYRIAGLAEDITEKKLAEEEIRNALEEKEVLIQEIHHRVKNNLQIISSLIALQMRKIEDKDPYAVLVDIRNRIFTMSILHQILYQSKDFSQINIKNLIQDITLYLIQSLQVDPDKIALHINIVDIRLNIEKALPCALIINEIISNSLKYAFPGTNKGNIRISLQKDENRLIFIIGDDGTGLTAPADFSHASSLGFTLLHAFAEQLEGTIELLQEKGTNYKLTFPWK